MLFLIYILYFSTSHCSFSISTKLSNIYWSNQLKWQRLQRTPRVSEAKALPFHGSPTAHPLFLPPNSPHPLLFFFFVTHTYPLFVLIDSTLREDHIYVRAIFCSSHLEPCSKFSNLKRKKYFVFYPHSHHVKNKIYE